MIDKEPSVGRYIVLRNDDSINLNCGALIGSFGIITDCSSGWIKYRPLDSPNEEKKCRKFVLVCDTELEVNFIKRLGKLLDKNVAAIQKLNNELLTALLDEGINEQFLDYDAESIIFGEG